MAVTKVVVSGNQGAGVKVNDKKVVGEQVTGSSFGTVAAAAGSTPTQAEFGAAVTTLNAVVTALKAHGLIDDAA
jgi:hypothetical protein